MLAVVDDAIPYIEGVLEPYMDVVYAPGGMFAKVLERYPQEEKCLVIRTRTRCDACLLGEANVKMIASATIGTDHIDSRFCYANSICVASAPGCNSGAVMQYVFTGLAYAGLLPERREDRIKLTLGVIGAGNVGEKVALLAAKLGFNVMRNDPPKQSEQEKAIAEGRLEQGTAIDYCSLEEVLECSDIITMHTPLDETTLNLAGERFFSLMKKGAHLINASRGGVVDDNALLNSRKLGHFICDVWNGEPKINLRILDRTSVATPHIAGYSVEGKQNATDAAVRALAGFAGIDELRDFTCRKSDERHRLNIEADINKQLLSFFPIGEMDTMLRKDTENFETIRKQYIYRNEFDY